MDACRSNELRGQCRLVPRNVNKIERFLSVDIQRPFSSFSGKYETTAVASLFIPFPTLSKMACPIPFFSRRRSWSFLPDSFPVLSVSLAGYLEVSVFSKYV